MDIIYDYDCEYATLIYDKLIEIDSLYQRWIDGDN